MENNRMNDSEYYCKLEQAFLCLFFYNFQDCYERMEANKVVSMTEKEAAVFIGDTIALLIAKEEINPDRSHVLSTISKKQKIQGILRIIDDARALMKDK